MGAAEHWNAEITKPKPLKPKPQLDDDFCCKNLPTFKKKHQRHKFTSAFEPFVLATNISNIIFFETKGTA